MAKTYGRPEPEEELQKVAEESVVEEPKATEVVTIKNIHCAPFMVCGHRIMPGGLYSLADYDAKQEKNMLRLESAVRKGYLERV